MPETSGASRPDVVYDPRRSRNTVVCPLCGSPKTQAKNYGKKLGGALGTGLGIISSLSATAKGATAGVIIAVRTTAPDTPLNSLTAAVLGAFAGGAMGWAINSLPTNRLKSGKNKPVWTGTSKNHLSDLSRLFRSAVI